MSRACAIVGIGQTQHARRRELTIAELCREAALRALCDADLTFADIDAVVLGKTPDIFDGLMCPELYLADALGAVGKPMLRIHTAGSVGGHTAIVAAQLVSAGIHERVLTVAYAKESEGDINWAVSGGGMPFASPHVAGPGGYFTPLIRSYIHRTGAPADIGIRIALKDRRNALKNPYAHVQIPDVTYDMIAASKMLWEPIRYLETCPSSDGACAMVLTNAEGARRAPHPPAWIHGAAFRNEPAVAPGRDEVNPLCGSVSAEEAYRQAGITDPRRELQMAELYTPFSWLEAMWVENLHLAPQGGGAWRLIERGGTALGGEMPINASGGVLGANPTGATGMIRFAEAAMQVRGQGGEHQVAGCKKALGHAQGGAASYMAVWVVASEKP